VKLGLSQAVDLYLRTRRRFGFALIQVGVELHSLVRFARENGHRGPLTTAFPARDSQTTARMCGRLPGEAPKHRSAFGSVLACLRS
jgi:hypothetical protein